MKHVFGGDWTEKKLKCVEDYLSAYTKILTGKGLSFAYIDAFAGTGYRQQREVAGGNLLFPELEEDEAAGFLAGSVQRALGVKPPFSNFIFIEKDPEKCAELKKIISQFPDKQNIIEVVNEDCNDYLSELCSKPDNWRGKRAVLFLDPFGMQVKWSTIECIAATKSIDVWLLFPLSAVTRMLPKSGEIMEAWKSHLDDIFGTTEWINVFYHRETVNTLLGLKDLVARDADFKRISDFWEMRLKSIFADVAKPAMLSNSKNVPLFLLCFAVGNPKAAALALRIARHLLKRI